MEGVLFQVENGFERFCGKIILKIHRSWGFNYL
jgi:hypothetical protein